MERRIIGYCRVSGEGQHGNDQDGIPRQHRVIESWAKKNKLQISQWIEDLGVSGTLAFAERPELSKLLVNLKPSGIFVVEKADRLARDLIEGELIIRHLSKSGWQVISAETGEDLANSESPTAILMRQLTGAIAEFDRRNIVTRLKVSRDRKRKETGRCEGRKAFSDQNVLIRIRKLIRKKNGIKPSLQWVANQLNAEGTKSDSGKLWTSGMVYHFVYGAGAKIKREPICNHLKI